MINTLKQNKIYLLSLFFALLSTIGACFYWLYKLNDFGVFAVILLSLIAFFIIIHFYHKNKAGANNKIPNIKENNSYILILWYILLVLICFFLLFNSRTDSSINSPWLYVPYYFFIFYSVATVILFFILHKKSKFALPLLSLYYFLSFSVALIVYKIGYGFDPFIHEATMNLIKEKGFVDPKPLYYLGEYSLVVIISKIFFIPLAWLNKILVPFLAALLLPGAIYKFLDKYFTDKKINNLIILILLILPFSIFIITTPQNLAYLFLLLTIFYGLTCSNFVELIIVYIFTLAALLTHPIAGIPAIFFVLALTIYHSDKKKIKKYLLIITFILSTIALPAAFYLTEKNTPASAVTLENTPKTVNIVNNILELKIPNENNFVLNFVYLINFNILLFIFLIITGGIILIYKNKKESNILFLNLSLGIALLISYLLVQKLSFNYVISYERSDFSQRIIIDIILILLPIIITAFYWFIEKTLEQKKQIQFFIFLFLLILIPTSLYLSYPRADRYENAKGYSVGQNDTQVVNWIEENHEKDYVVLANQQVSAAALKEIGFTRYYKDNIYFYPIPTSSPLYEYYLKMVYDKPSRENILGAMDLAGVDEAYFVLNKYWWAFDKIKDEAKLEADSWQEIGNVYIFKYNKS